MKIPNTNSVVELYYYTKPYLKFLSIFQKEKFTSAADEAENVQQAMQGMCC